ncbi:ABC transporter substrate-binding protein [Chelatococcus asaccharovorans]|uniref:Thiamine pyrimidine synthase n=1 Tax=Chelatococcus asaccharovorans TaxID=28210 RepID=A0A2V3UEX6_9HYPH|nr:ABC transporter substrate-binding protein [Chelatococcus asaccharovorans]MBS7702900.1 ABC transporter substrate-binding protein [Chelatococcus asaccharovorans]PXW57200.1 NitT/TauT family transport system substrate-binding protein [Chelatococcus asaccharovorans]
MSSTKKSSKITALVCAAAGLMLTAANAQAADQVSLRLNTILNGWHCPWHMARDKGWFKEAGIEIKEIGEGRGSADTAQLVAAGTDTFGLVDPAVVIAGVARGLPVKTVYSLINKSLLAVVSPADKPIKTAADLKGKQYVTLAGSGALQMFQAVLAANKMKPEDVKILTVDPAAQYATLMSGQVDGILIGLDGVPDLEARGFKYFAVTYPELGVNTIVSSVATTTDLINKNPDLVKRFIAVTQRAWDHAIKNPDDVVKACLAVKPTSSEAAFRKQLADVISALRSDNNKDKPLGFGAEKDWQMTLDVQKEYRGIKTDKPLTAFYTNEFVPQ